MKSIRRHAISHLTKEEKQENRTIFALCVIFFLPAINNFINSFFQLGLSLRYTFFTPISYIFMAFLSVFFLYRFIMKRGMFVGIFLFFLIGSVISYFLYPEIRSLIYGSPVDLVYSPVNKLVYYCIPVLIGISCLTDYEKLFEKMRKWAIVTAFLGTITYCFVTFVAGKELQYMVYSYFLLLPVCVCFEYANMKNTKIDLVIAVIASVSMLACGARGTIVSLLLYFLICFYRYDFKRMRSGQIFTLFSLMLTAVVVLLFYNELLELVANVFEHLDIDSRVIRYLQNGNFLFDSGRQSIGAAVKKGLMANPFGYGIFGDRYVAGYFGSGNYRYVHNIFLELWCDFGIFLGSIVIVILMFALFNLFVSVKGRKEIHLVFALIPYALFQLLFSSSYLENIPFFALMGLTFFGIQGKRFIIKMR